MGRQHFWYSEQAHKLLQEVMPRRDFSGRVVDEPGFIQVLPDGKIATYAREVDAGNDASTYQWPDKVYLGEYDRDEVRTVRADDFESITISE